MLNKKINQSVFSTSHHHTVSSAKQKKQMSKFIKTLTNLVEKVVITFLSSNQLVSLKNIRRDPNIQDQNLNIFLVNRRILRLLLKVFHLRNHEN